MGSPKELALELSRTPRGRLSYDRDCFKGQSSLEEILEEVEAQNRSMKVSLLAELSSEMVSLSPEASFSDPPPPAFPLSSSLKEISSPEVHLRGEELLPSPTKSTPLTKPTRKSLISSLSPSSGRTQRFRLNRSLEMSCPSEFSVVREAKRRSLERRIILDNFIRDEVREAEVLFGKKCKIMSDENAVDMPEEEKENKIRNKIRAEDKIKEEECKNRISALEETLSREVKSVSPSPVAVVCPEETPKLPMEARNFSNLGQQAPQETIPVKELSLSLNRPQATPQRPPPTLSPVKPLESQIPQEIEVPPILKQEINEQAETSQRNLEMLRDVEAFHASFKSKLSGFSDKSLKFDLQKAVSTIINAICQVSKAHLKEKLEKLTALASGQPIVVGESKTVNVASNPLGTDYVKFIMAEKFISHWDEQPKSIFALGAIMAALSSNFPDFGKLLLAVFYRTCPYILPSHNIQRAGESWKDFRMRCGYSYEEDTEENKEMFIKHMTGVIRLYTAYSIADLPQSYTDRLIFHGLGNLWRLISSTLNLKPMNEITAIVLCEVIEIAGHVLLETYKDHFKSILDLIQRQFIPLIKEITQEGCYGSVSRLEDLFEKFKASQTIPKAEGSLESGFL